ncbi:TetR/AcrR family transcriptional regulator [Streptosporangiaceae bacterium NEAU-GS5]|nr:TetR/AcrR family transcriptional regulator [Streptosporangiaceae bacterium NEAU-GS5]
MTTLEQGNETRARILAAARRLFADRGYAATSLADIAAAVGLTKTAVAYHFHPKDKLAAELIAPAADELFALLGREDGADGPARDGFIRDFIAFAVRHREVIRLLVEDIGTADAAPPGSPGEAIRAFRDEIHAKLAGPHPDGPARVRAWAVIGIVQCGIINTMDQPEETVAEILARSALAIYKS